MADGDAACALTAPSNSGVAGPDGSDHPVDDDGGGGGSGSPRRRCARLGVAWKTNVERRPSRGGSPPAIPGALAVVAAPAAAVVAAAVNDDDDDDVVAAAAAVVVGVVDNDDKIIAVAVLSFAVVAAVAVGAVTVTATGEVGDTNAPLVAPTAAAVGEVVNFFFCRRRSAKTCPNVGPATPSAKAVWTVSTFVS